jgi:mono/diheme cytochrome c family protein
VSRKSLILTPAALAALGALLLATAGLAQEDPEFTEEYLSNQDNIQLGKELFQQQCNKCHGKGAYPGKAPKLRPRKLSPEDIYLRITYGFRRMPPWEEVYTNEQRMALTAYLKSDIFSN